MGGRICRLMGRAVPPDAVTAVTTTRNGRLALAPIVVSGLSRGAPSSITDAASLSASRHVVVPTSSTITACSAVSRVGRLIAASRSVSSGLAANGPTSRNAGRVS